METKPAFWLETDSQKACEIAKIVVGQEELVTTALIALVSGGHVLIEGVPGLGKTLFVKTLGQVIGCKFGRIQFTADLMPSDVTGAPIFDMKLQDFRFRPGPVFVQLLLADMLAEDFSLSAKMPKSRDMLTKEQLLVDEHLDEVLELGEPSPNFFPTDLRSVMFEGTLGPAVGSTSFSN